MAGEVSAVTRTYDLALWQLPHVARFSRGHRFTLGDRTEKSVPETLDILVEASYARDKRELLRRANVRLERPRHFAKPPVCLPAGRQARQAYHGIIGLEYHSAGCSLRIKHCSLQQLSYRNPSGSHCGSLS